MEKKERVRKYGEVFTPEWLVKDMVELVGDCIQQIDKTVLEPSCGEGAFLLEILDRKMLFAEKIAEKYFFFGKSEEVLCDLYVRSVQALYGVEIQLDNTVCCRNKLFDRFCTNVQKIQIPLDTERIVRKLSKQVKEILGLNIVCGDFLSGRFCSNNEPITFMDWRENTVRQLYTEEHMREIDIEREKKRKKEEKRLAAKAKK